MLHERSALKSHRKFIRTCGGIQERCIFTSMVWIWRSCPNGSATQTCLHLLFALTPIQNINGMRLKKRWAGSTPELLMPLCALLMTMRFSRSFMEEALWNVNIIPINFAADYAGSEFLSYLKIRYTNFLREKLRGW